MDTRTWLTLAMLPFILVPFALGCAGKQDSSNAPAPRGQLYFYYSSDDDASVVLLAPDAKRRLENVSVIAGLDPGGDLQSTTFRESAGKLLKAGWKLHVYLEGPGGPTGTAWDKDECARVQSAAKLNGEQSIPSDDKCTNDSALWMVTWNESGFLKHLERQLAQLKDLDVQSVEVDNLYRAGYGNKKPLSDFVSRFAVAKKNSGSTAKLVLKNIETPAQLDALMAQVPRSEIADIMIIEDDFKKDWCSLQAAARKHQIISAFSWDTEHYHAEVDGNGTDIVFAGPEKDKRRAWGCAAR